MDREDVDELRGAMEDRVAETPVPVPHGGGRDPDGGIGGLHRGDELRVPVGTVKSRVFYALKAMRLALEELGWTDDV